MQLAFGEARRVAQQPGHGVLPARGVFEALPKNHVAAALAMHRPCLGKAPQAGFEPLGQTKGIGMQLRITAGEPTTIRAFGGWLIGKRRKRNDLRAGAAPGFKKMRIDEAEGPILRQRDALTGRRQGGCHTIGGADAKRRGARDQRIQIEMALGHRGETLDQAGEIGMLAGLHQAEMALRQSKRRLARHRAEHRDAEGNNRIRDQRAVLLAGDAIEDDSGDANGRIVRGKTAYDGRRRLRLPRYVEHKHDREREMCGKVRGRAALPRHAAGAVEQTHHAFDDEKIRIIGRLPRQGIEQRGRHGPAVEIDARCADHSRVKCRVDVIRTGLCRAQFEAAPHQRRQHGERDRGLAGAGAWRGDDDPARRHVPSLLDGAVSPTSRSRMATISPITTMAGGSNSCVRASPASFSSVDTRTRCRGVVAEAITAAGVAPASPPSINAAAIRSRLCITM